MQAYVGAGRGNGGFEPLIRLDMPDLIRLDDYRDEPALPPMAETGFLGMDPRVLAGLLVVSIAVCTPVVFWYAPEDWGLVRKLAGSLILGMLCHYCLFINRILVAKW